MDTLDEESRRGILDQLRWSLQALAQPGEVQLTLLPHFVPTADELALDFDDWFGMARLNLQHELSDVQLEACRSVDLRLDSMSRGGPDFDEVLWDAAALADRQEWEDVRALARLALASLGWPVEVPASGRVIDAHGSNAFEPAPPSDPCRRSRLKHGDADESVGV